MFLFFYLLVKNVKCDWIHSMLVKEINNKTQRILIFTPQNVWIHDSFFQDIIEKLDPGGAILMDTNSESTYLLVEYTTFNNCTCYQQGGSIYHSLGNFIMYSVCNCNYGIENGHPDVSNIYSISTNTQDNFQEIEFCSVDSNVNGNYIHLHEGPIALINGCISIKSLNISQEKYIDHGNVFHIQPFSDYYYNVIQYSSFVNKSRFDNGQVGSILFIESEMQIFMCNILKNKAIYIFSVQDDITIRNSCILYNSCSYLVYLPSSSQYASFYNCTCQKVTSNYQTRIGTYNTPSSSFIHALDCLQTGFCVAEYDYLEKYVETPPNQRLNIQEKLFF